MPRIGAPLEVDDITLRHDPAVRRGDSVAVVGCGGVGLASIQGARLAGAGRTIAIDPVPGDVARSIINLASI